MSQAVTEALIDIMLRANKPRSLKQIVQQVRAQVPNADEADVEKRLHLSGDHPDLALVVTKSAGKVDRYEWIVKRDPSQVLTPAGIVPAASLPTRPIHFGRPKTNVPVSATPEPAPAPTAGSRSAMSFIQSLKAGT